MSFLELTTPMKIHLDSQEYKSFKEVEEAVSSYYEEFWEKNFELHEQNPAKFEEACMKIRNIARLYCEEKNLKF